MNTCQLFSNANANSNFFQTHIRIQQFSFFPRSFLALWLVIPLSVKLTFIKRSNICTHKSNNQHKNKTKGIPKVTCLSCEKYNYSTLFVCVTDYACAMCKEFIRDDGKCERTAKGKVLEHTAQSVGLS